VPTGQLGTTHATGLRRPVAQPPPLLLRVLRRTRTVLLRNRWRVPEVRMVGGKPRKSPRSRDDAICNSRDENLPFLCRFWVLIPNRRERTCYYSLCRRAYSGRDGNIAFRHVRTSWSAKICPEVNAAAPATISRARRVDRFTRMWERVGMRVGTMSADHHDKVLETCTGYGFHPGTDAFASCLQKESLARRYLTPPLAPYWRWGYRGWGGPWGPYWPRLGVWSRRPP
jgi:hypothetical protein